jgi:hypothetical protein
LSGESKKSGNGSGGSEDSQVCGYECYVPVQGVLLDLLDREGPHREVLTPGKPILTLLCRSSSLSLCLLSLLLLLSRSLPLPW